MSDEEKEIEDDEEENEDGSPCQNYSQMSFTKDDPVEKQYQVSSKDDHNHIVDDRNIASTKKIRNIKKCERSGIISPDRKYREDDGEISPLLRIVSCESLCAVGPDSKNVFSKEGPISKRFYKDECLARKFGALNRKGSHNNRDMSPRGMGDCFRKSVISESKNEVFLKGRNIEENKYMPLNRAKLEPMRILVPTPSKTVKGMSVAEFNKYQADKKLYENIAKIRKSRAKVDCHMDPKLMDNTYRVRRSSRQRVQEHTKLAKENLKLLEILQGPKSQYNREEQLTDFKKNYVAMMKLGKHPENWTPPKGVQAVTVNTKSEARNCASISNVSACQRLGSRSRRP